MSLSAIFAPRGVAVVGASDNAKKFGGLCLENLITGGYEGNIVPVNPSKSTVMGVKAYPSVSAIDVPVDVVAIAVPKRFVFEILEECAEKRILYVMVMSGGYGEQGPDGAIEEQRLVSRARELGIRIIGPNLLGLGSTPSKLLLNASLAMRQVEAREGGISVAAQSGATMAILYNRGAREGVRFRHLIALGNQADVEVSEVIRFYAEDLGTKVVIASIEGLKDNASFFAAAAECHRANKPLIVIKSGRTDEGAKVAATHTGSLASNYSGFQARCAAAGITLVDDEMLMMRLAAMYDRYGSPPAEGGVALLSPSGGAIAQMADRLVEEGLRLSIFGKDTVADLEEIYVPNLTSNPLDFANLKDNSFLNVGDGGASIISKEKDVAAIVAVLGPAHNLGEMAAGIGAGVKTSKPLIFAVLPGSNGDEAREVAAELGFLTVNSIEEAVQTLKYWLKPRPAIYATASRPAELPTARVELDGTRTFLGEFEAKQILQNYGIRVTQEYKATSIDEAVAAAEKIGYPVALKGYGAKLIHKSEFGAVQLDLRNEEAVRKAWTEMENAIGPALEGCLVSEMVSGHVEVIIGGVQSAEFGPMIMFGAGGVLAELLKDVAMLPAPSSKDAIQAKLTELKFYPLLSGFRGRLDCDIEALVDTIYRAGFFFSDLSGRISEFDINPLIVRSKGEGATVVDARIQLSNEPSLELESQHERRTAP